MRFSIVAFATLALAQCLHAGFVHVWGIKEIEDSPLLVVATVENIAKKEALPKGQSRSPFLERYWEATLRVHRAYSPRALASVARLTVRYVSNADQNSRTVQGNPICPSFEKGETALFALAPRESGPWRLVADEGFNLTVPAIVPELQGTPAARDGRAFILLELANALANGRAASRYQAAVYLREAGVWPEGLREIVEQAVGTSDDRWLEVACALLASMGIPHPTIVELLANPNLTGTANQAASWALAKAGRRDHPDRLIRCLLRNMPAYDWGAANRLLEFKDSPVVVREMGSALVRDPSGSIYVAWTLVRNGQRAFLREALDAAMVLVRSPDEVPMNRLQASSSLLRDFGSDEQFDLIVATLRRLKTQNENAYRKLFGSVSYMQSRRELRVAAVLIDDYRWGFRTLRYCDVAAATVQKLTGENLGIQQEMTLQDRDRAVTGAAAWLRGHPNAR